LYLPHHAFNRKIGEFSARTVAPDGTPLSQGGWSAHHQEWLPTIEDEIFVASLMKPCFEMGKVASWIAPPHRGINGRPGDYEYVRL